MKPPPGGVDLHKKQKHPKIKRYLINQTADQVAAENQLYGMNMINNFNIYSNNPSDRKPISVYIY